MEKWYTLLAGALITSLLSCSCSRSSSSTVDQSDSTRTEQKLVLGSFSADSAYKYIERQVAFGPRVPGTPEHDACAQYLIDELRRLKADTMYVQRGVVEAFNGDKLPITNIIAGYKPDALRRILLVAHWDTRPWADSEHSDDDRSKPVLGANDGASGVGVLLEIARNLTMQKPNVGVDILFVDAEDYGDNSGFGDNTATWCLGTQYWLDNMVPYTAQNLPVYGILLDMVGGKNARFHYEQFSKANAPTPTLKVWSEAQRLDHDNIFINKMGGNITDDHVFLTNGGIPTTNIVETVNEATGYFPPQWHTLNDDMSGISKESLKAVGETVLNVVYKEKAY